MKLKNSFFYTLGEDVKDEESISGSLLVRSGMIKKTSTGIYMFLPLGLRIIDNIKQIVREEMDKTGAQEMLMPSLIASEVYGSCGRLEAFGDSMFKLKDRANRDMVLGPTHEELFTIAAKSMIRSYRHMPFTLYQIGDKFRDEARPRFGLIRVKEFFMKDAYSFDKDEASLDISYKRIYDAYINIFDRMGIDYKIVRADTGAMGGSLSEEFQAVTDIGEDNLVLCDHCDYASNLEVSNYQIADCNEDKQSLELVKTPESKTIEEVAAYLNIPTSKTVKAMLMNVDGELVVFFLRGDRTFNESKACKLLNAREITFASDDLIASSNAVPGFTGPISLNAKKVLDSEILHMKNFCVGANREGYHYINANTEDFEYDLIGNITDAVEGDICPKCGGTLYFKRGIEIGNTFKLGTKYSEKLNLIYLDENNTEKYVWMGCYGIGIGRILAAIIEQNNDEHGMILPMNIAPYKVAIVLINDSDNAVSYANNLHDELEKRKIPTILDDRDERAGVKFNDMDLIGIPIRITVGKKFNDDLLEIKIRKTSEVYDVSPDNIISHISDLIEKETK